MSHQIKVGRALKASAIGRCPGSAEAMLSHVPPSALAKLTGRELGELLDSLWRACQDAKGIAAREAIDEGCIWDAKHGVLREVGTA